MRDFRYLMEGVSGELIQIDVSDEADVLIECDRRPGRVPAIDVRLFRRQHIESGLALTNEAEVHHCLDMAGVPCVMANEWMCDPSSHSLQRSWLRVLHRLRQRRQEGTRELTKRVVPAEREGNLQQIRKEILQLPCDVNLGSQAIARVGKGNGDVGRELAQAPHRLLDALCIPCKETLRVEQEEFVAEFGDSVGHDFATEVVAASEPGPRRDRADNAWAYHVWCFSSEDRRSRPALIGRPTSSSSGRVKRKVCHKSRRLIEKTARSRIGRVPNRSARSHIIAG